MRKLAVLLSSALLAACGSGSDGTGNPPTGSSACTIDAQKQFVLDNLYYWYLWNDILPPGINIASYASPEQLVFEVTRNFGPKNASDEPIDLFSSVGSLQADTEFFGEGKFEGFGFSWRFEDQAQTDFRVTRTFLGSPADNGGLMRGDQILSLNTRTVADIVANEGISAFFDANGELRGTTLVRQCVRLEHQQGYRHYRPGSAVAYYRCRQRSHGRLP